MRPAVPRASIPIAWPSASSRTIRGAGSLPGGRTFIATHMRPSGSTATSTAAPSRVSSVIVFSGHSSAPVVPDRLRIVGRGTPPITVWPTSIKSSSGVTATRFVRLPSGPAIDHASVPGSGVDTLTRRCGCPRTCPAWR
jgi:hypothetical protein